MNRKKQMKFIVTDRSGIEEGVLVRSPYIVISIHDTYSPPARVKKQSGLRAMLELAFDDAEPTASSELEGAFTLMTCGQADEIWKFVDQHKDRVAAVSCIARRACPEARPWRRLCAKAWAETTVSSGGTISQTCMFTVWCLRRGGARCFNETSFDHEPSEAN